MRIVALDYKLTYQQADIWRGFGLQHLSDVTHYYVHRKNESPTASTRISKAMAEAVNLFAAYLKDEEWWDRIKVYTSRSAQQESMSVLAATMTGVPFFSHPDYFYRARLCFSNQDASFSIAVNTDEEDKSFRSSISNLESQVFNFGFSDLERFNGKREDYWLISDYRKEYVADLADLKHTLCESGVAIDLRLPFKEKDEGKREREVKRIVADYSFFAELLFSPQRLSIPQRAGISQTHGRIYTGAATGYPGLYLRKHVSDV